ncbi:MAG: hypothetical protein PWQ10_122 [Patescibacteria group bacterium]|nr:hypothetical protein [Patescibacteria group bacterium]
MFLKDNKQSGVVSLILVVFSMLLITIVTVGFTRVMVKDQQQANATDLSQSAYDSAQAGIEDAKRALLYYQNVCQGYIVGNCVSVANIIGSPSCNEAVIKTLGDVSGKIGSDGEIKIQTNSSDNDLEQAYTCLKIILNTNDYLGELSKDTSDIIPLSSVSPFDTVKIEWFSSKDLSSSDNKKATLSNIITTPLLATADWATTTPPAMRAQLIQFSKKGATLSELDQEIKNGNGSNTLFLYPLSVGSNNLSFLSDSPRRSNNQSSANSPLPVKCVKDLSATDYSCSVSIKTPEVVDGLEGTVYLRLTALYNQARYRVSLTNSSSSNVVKFNGVQPEVDSTGRANDLYRRVVSRVELTDIYFPYPEAEVDTTDGLCKDFVVTDRPNDYNEYLQNRASCKN